MEFRDVAGDAGLETVGLAHLSSVEVWRLIHYLASPRVQKGEVDVVLAHGGLDMFLISIDGRGWVFQVNHRVVLDVEVLELGGDHPLVRPLALEGALVHV